MSYILKVYYQALTSAGAMTVTVPYDLPMRKLIEVLPLLSGLVVPNGYDSEGKAKEFSTKLAFIYNWAKNRNDEGDFFSIVAIGKGFRELMKVSNGKSELIQDCTNPNLDWHGNLVIDLVEFKSTNILKLLPQTDFEEILGKEGSVPFNHNCSIPVSRFMTSTLPAQYHMIATSTTKQGGLQFVALVEHRKYPFVGMQFNPEVSAFYLSGGHAKDSRTLKFYRDLLSKFLTSESSRQIESIDSLPLSVRNLLMYKDIPVYGLKDQSQIFLYRRWAAGRDIDLPN